MRPRPENDGSEVVLPGESCTLRAHLAIAWLLSRVKKNYLVGLCSDFLFEPASLCQLAAPQTPETPCGSCCDVTDTAPELPSKWFQFLFQCLKKTNLSSACESLPT